MYTSCYDLTEWVKRLQIIPSNGRAEEKKYRKCERKHGQNTWYKRVYTQSKYDRFIFFLLFLSLEEALSKYYNISICYHIPILFSFVSEFAIASQHTRAIHTYLYIRAFSLNNKFFFLSLIFYLSLCVSHIQYIDESFILSVCINTLTTRVRAA